MDKYTAAIIFLVIGLLNMWTPFIEMATKWRNMTQGTATNITQGTIWTHRVMGMIFIGLAVYFIFQVQLHP
jgi:threonine/homoserine/homoserine lactone efflux protein